jgi:dUTP pyrophosphatase
MDFKKFKNMDSTLKALEKMIKKDEKDNIKQVEDVVGLDLADIEASFSKTMNTVDTKINISYKNLSGLEDPVYKHSEDSGFDFRANIENSLILKPLERTLVPTGLYFEVHPEYELQVRPRSGLAIKNGITVLNTPGTVDSNYRGEIKIILINLSNENFKIERGDRIAQGVFNNVLKPKWLSMNKVDKLSDSSRNKGGFGSTGKK